MPIQIRSEEEAWEALEGLIKGDIKVDSVEEIQLGEWIKSSLYIPNGRYNSSLNTYMMKGWIDAQSAIYRSYALVAHGEANGRLLTDAEKEELELIVTVNGGSSDQEADLWEVITEVLVGAVDKMDPTTLAIVIVALALIWAGQTVWRTWLNNRKEERLAETSNNTVIKALEAIETVSKSDQRRDELLKQAIERQPVLQDLKEQADDARHSLVHHASKTDAVVNGISLPSGASSALTTSSRTSSTEVRKDGTYYVQKVDTTVPDGFRVYVEDMNSGETFAASVQEVMSSEEDRKVIQEAEWSKSPVSLQVNARMKKNTVIEAIILRANKYEPETTERERKEDRERPKLGRDD